jgi:hypothetical protein
VQALIPSEAKVTLLGDGEFDGTFLQETVRLFGWQWVVRTAKNSQYPSPVSKKWHSFSEWKLQAGRMVVRRRIGFSAEGWGPLTSIGVRDVGYKEPIYLITSLKDAQDAIALYFKRFRIESFFTDQKSRGKRIGKEPFGRPRAVKPAVDRLCLRLLVADHLGTYARQNDWDKVVYRTERCVLSFPL